MMAKVVVYFRLLSFFEFSKIQRRTKTEVHHLLGYLTIKRKRTSVKLDKEC